MSDEGGESKSVGAFLLGFLTGVLVCVGIGGGLFMVVGRRAAMQADMARMEAEMVRREAVEQRARAEAERRVAEENERKAKAAANQIGEAILPKPKELKEKKEPQKDKEKSE